MWELDGSGCKRLVDSVQAPALTKSTLQFCLLFVRIRRGREVTNSPSHFC